MDERRAWQQPIHAQLFHQGVPPAGGVLTAQGRALLAVADLTPAGRRMVDTAPEAIDSLTELIVPLRAQLQAIGRRQPGVQALMSHDGVGALCAALIWAELGDCRRLSNSDQAVRFAGLDVTVWSSDGERSPGRLARQGSPVLRGALFEAAKAAAREGSPDHEYYVAVREGLGGKRPALSVARKLVRRCHHTLRAVGGTLPVARREAGSLTVLTGTRPRPGQLMFAAGSRHHPVAVVLDGRPGKNEQPRYDTGFTPSAITSPVRHRIRLVHPDKAGRRRVRPAHISASGGCAHELRLDAGPRSRMRRSSPTSRSFVLADPAGAPA